MADVKYDKLNLVGLHEPDSTMETNADGIKERNGLPGLYSVGILANGKFHKLATIKAGDMVDENNKVQLGSKPAAKKGDDADDDSGDESGS
jgi:hypothetical protein